MAGAKLTTPWEQCLQSDIEQPNALGGMSYIAKGVPLFSARGMGYVVSSFGLFMVPGYALFKINTSEMVKGDLQGQLPRRPDLPMGGNVGLNQRDGGRVFKAEENLNEMLARVQRGERVELQTPHDVTEEQRKGRGRSQHPITQSLGRF